MGKKVNLAAYKAEKQAEHGIEIEGENGEVFRVDPPHLWPDEVLEQLDTAGGLSTGTVRVARALLGDQYDAFVAAGGSAALLSMIVEDQVRGALGESQASSPSSKSTGKQSRPTSSASTE
jgi:hypothetical protein